MYIRTVDIAKLFAVSDLIHKPLTLYSNVIPYIEIPPYTNYDNSEQPRYIGSCIITWIVDRYLITQAISADEQSTVTEFDTAQEVYDSLVKRKAILVYPRTLKKGKDF